MPDALEVVVPEPAPLPPEVGPTPLPWADLAYRRPQQDWSQTLRDLAGGLHLVATPDGHAHIANPENLLVQHEHRMNIDNSDGTLITTFSRLDLPDGRTLARTNRISPTEAAYRPGGWDTLRAEAERMIAADLVREMTNTILREADVPTTSNIYLTTASITTAYQQYTVAMNTTAATLSNAYERYIAWPAANGTAAAPNVWAGLRNATTTGGTWTTPVPMPVLDPAALRREHRRRAVASGRAKRLLRSALENPQLATLDERGYFEVVGESGRRYRIYQGISMNVVALDAEGREALRLCAHPAFSAPAEDHMLMQKLVLETDERAFLAKANKQEVWAAGQRVSAPIDLLAAITAARRQAVPLAA